MLRRVTFVRTEVSEKCSASIITVSRIGELVRVNVVPSSTILDIWMMKALRSSETSDLTRATRCNIPEDCILHSPRLENLKSYITLTDWAL
jgi:hypothetical protein